MDYPSPQVERIPLTTCGYRAVRLCAQRPVADGTRPWGDGAGEESPAPTDIPWSVELRAETYRASLRCTYTSLRNRTATPFFLAGLYFQDIAALINCAS